MRELLETIYGIHQFDCLFLFKLVATVNIKLKTVIC